MPHEFHEFRSFAKWMLDTHHRSTRDFHRLRRCVEKGATSFDTSSLSPSPSPRKPLYTSAASGATTTRFDTTRCPRNLPLRTPNVGSRRFDTTSYSSSCILAVERFRHSRDADHTAAQKALTTMKTYKDMVFFGRILHSGSIDTQNDVVVVVVTHHTESHAI